MRVGLAAGLLLIVASTAAAAGPLEPASISPDRTARFYWRNPLHSASLAADGLPLVVRRGSHQWTLVRSMLPQHDFISWCGTSLVAVAGGGRYTTSGKRLVVAAPPYRRIRELSRDGRRSWVSPSCSPDGRWVVVSAGRNWIEPRFGLERRSLWLLRLDGRERRRLTRQRADVSDEAPCFSSDGGTVFFVATEPSPKPVSAGRLMSYRLRDGKTTPLQWLEPVGNAYGNYTWTKQLARFCAVSR